MIDNKLKEKFNILSQEVDDLKKHFQKEKWENEIIALQKEMEDPQFWSDNKKSTRYNKRLKILKDQLEKYNNVSDDFSSLKELIEIADETNMNEIDGMIKKLEEQANSIQMELLFKDELDDGDAILTIHPGAGGTESCDWAQMLFRMYTKFFVKKGFEYEVMDLEPGDIAGIKNVSINVTGAYAYGYLKPEIGVHRLVRISPFDSNSRRHTSFVSVYVYPDIEKNTDFDIDENELKIDTFRSSGPGGQNVNKLSTAIRITHMPTGIIAKSQTERSQFKNKVNAMKILKAKVYQHYKEIEEQKYASKLEEKKSIEWGNQIRSYVLYPYKMIKDLRTRYETSNVDGVLDGDIDRFIKEYLIAKARNGGKLGK